MDEVSREGQTRLRQGSPGAGRMRQRARGMGRRVVPERACPRSHARSAARQGVSQPRNSQHAQRQEHVSRFESGMTVPFSSTSIAWQSLRAPIRHTRHQLVASSCAFVGGCSDRRVPHFCHVPSCSPLFLLCRAAIASLETPLRTPSGTNRSLPKHGVPPLVKRVRCGTMPPHDALTPANSPIADNLRILRRFHTHLGFKCIKLYRGAGSTEEDAVQTRAPTGMSALRAAQDAHESWASCLTQRWQRTARNP